MPDPPLLEVDRGRSVTEIDHDVGFDRLVGHG